MAFSVYLLRCNDGSYYVGHTEDLEFRLAQHQAGTLGGYTAKRRPVTLAWCDTFAERDQAFWVERKLKGWGRAKKEALIAGDWELIQALARKRVANPASTSSA
ncbi:GIY-YIG nuclease family protein [Novosphingobium sp. NPDC080210]|uniref:GIY-YIG nuclease family protein n=1 Tax=Novosphingobium sp. NPDC080210 TaxID=3390596 RepID=UPI003D05B75F